MKGFLLESPLRVLTAFLKLYQGEHLALFTNRLEPHKKYEMYYYNVEGQKYTKLERFTLHFNSKRGVYLLQFDSMPSNQYKLVELSVTPL